MLLSDGTADIFGKLPPGLPGSRQSYGDGELFGVGQDVVGRLPGGLPGARMAYENQELFGLGQDMFGRLPPGLPGSRMSEDSELFGLGQTDGKTDWVKIGLGVAGVAAVVGIIYFTCCRKR